MSFSEYNQFLNNNKCANFQFLLLAAEDSPKMLTTRCSSPLILFIIENMTTRGSKEQFLDTFLSRFSIIVVLTLFSLIENILLCSFLKYQIKTF